MRLSTRFRVLTRDNFRCRYCGSNDRLTVDHVTPRADGGSDDIGNLVTACRACNTGKGATVAAPPAIGVHGDTLSPPVSPEPKTDPNPDERAGAVVCILRTRLPANHKLVLLALAARCQVGADGGWTCWPSLPTIATDCSLSRSTVAKIIAELEHHGLITHVNDRDVRESNTYMLDFWKLQAIRQHKKGDKIVKMDIP